MNISCFSRVKTFPHILLLVALFAGSASSVLAGTCVTVPTNLVGWWRADGNAMDELTGNAATLAGDVSYGLGEVNQAFTFDGSGDVVNIGNAAAYQMQNFSIEGWIRRDSLTNASQTAGGGMILAWGTAGFGFGLQDDGKLFLSQIGYSSAASTLAVTGTNAFHHIAVTKTNGSVIFYIDGVSAGSASYNPTFLFTNSVAGIGARGDGTSSFIGALDEVSLYRGTLSSSQIQTII